MAKTIAKCTGGDSTREKSAHRLGSRYARGEANTWRTFSDVTIFADGSGRMSVKRDGKILHEYSWEAES